jgi:hypothetical protein
VEPCGRDSSHGAGGDDAVIGRAGWVALRSIDGGQGGGVAVGGQPFAGQVDQLRVNVHAGDLAAAEPLTQQRTGVAAVGADLQHAMSLTYLQRFEHPQHQRGKG